MDEFDLARVSMTLQPELPMHFHWACHGGPDGCTHHGDTFTPEEAWAQIEHHLSTHYPTP
jgi:hypothetical protein